MFDIYYLGDNKKIAQQFPFAQQVDSVKQVKPNTKMYWLVEPNVEVTDTSVFAFRPSEYDQEFEHVWKWDNQNYGGVRLKPVDVATGVKEVNTVVCKKTFDILHTKTPGKYFERNPHATHVWCVDKEYKLGDSIDWAPGNFEPNFIHTFHLRGQLEHKYPKAEGGVKLFPREWQDCEYKYHKFLDASAKYPVLRVADVEDYAQRDKFADEYVWLIDEQLQLDVKSLDWVPNPFEAEFIHSFRTPYQLTDKYPHRLGGIRLVPQDWQTAFKRIHSGVVVHPDTPIRDIEYDLFYVNEDEFTAEQYSELAERARTDWFWVVDREYEFNGRLTFVPGTGDEDYIHVFKIPGMLEERYPTDVTEPWDNRCGGVRLVNKNFDMTKHKYQSIMPVRYDVFYVDDTKDWETPARKSSTKMFWLIDKAYVADVSADVSSIMFDYVPPRHEQNFALNFQIPGSLEHRYPDEEGGVWLIPAKYNDNTQPKYKGSLTVERKVSVEKQTTQYPIKFVKNPKRIKTVEEDTWVADQRYNLGTRIDWNPSSAERSSVHVFGVANQLEDVYNKGEGGVRWVPNDWDGVSVVVHAEPLPISFDGYPIFRSSDPSKKPDYFEACWCIDEEYEFDGDIDWTPYVFEADVTHVFHIRDQLKRKYTEDMGGVYWHPRSDSKSKTQLKIHDLPLVVDVPVYNSYFVEDPSAETNTKQPGWYIDQQYRIEGITNVVPYQNAQERDMIHVFHVRNQLSRKYTEEMGGVYWIPENWNGEFYIHTTPVRTTAIPYTSFTTDFPAEIFKTVEGPVWCIDADYDLPETIFDIPFQNEDEMSMVHVYHVKDQLRHKYPANMGGVYWIPENWNGDVVVHEDTLQTSKTYPIYRAEDPTIPPDIDQPCWVIDELYCVRDDISWVPDVFEKDQKHVFHIEGQLRNKYSDHIGGAYFYPADKNIEELNVHTEPLTVTATNFPIHFVKDPTDYSDVYENCWLVDREYYISKTDLASVIPFQNEEEKQQVHVYHVKDQLKHKYPEEMGGVYWVPAKNKSAELNVHKETPFGVNTTYDIFASEEEGRENTRTDWFWVIESSVQVHEDFTFNFVPETWDAGKTHVWQKLNPVTGKQFDYGGVQLCAKEAAKGRPKYIREPGCYELQYPIYVLESNKDWIEQLKQFDEQTDANMFWVIDPFAKPLEDFDFSYYPTQYDRKNVHVFTDYKDENSGIRLYPKNTNWDITEEDVLFNKFTNLKLMPEVATEKPIWPVHNFKETTVQELNNILTTSKERGMSYVWTVDTDVVPYAEVIEMTVDKTTGLHSDSVNAFQIVVNDVIEGNGGLRFWPTNFDTSELTDEQLRTNDFEGVRYIEIPGSTMGKYPVHYLNADEDIVEQLTNIEVTEPMFWAVDPGTVVRSDFDFRYYPGKWDEKFVHVFATADGEYRNVRLYPAKLFKNETYTIEEITNNSFKQVKLIEQVASAPGKWPVATFDQINVAELQRILFDNRDAEYVWTVDPGVEVDDTLIHSSYTPRLEDATRPHVWKIKGGEGFGGVRLWPTSYDPSHLTDEQVKVCDIAEQQIVEGGGYVVADLPVFNLTHLDNFHDQLKAFDEECTVSMFWVLDPFTELHDDWEFNKFRPNQWDEDTVHVFKNTHDEYRGARLYPKGTFTGEAFYQLAEIENNSFPNLKQIDITVTKPACYPTIKFGTGKDEVLMENFVSKIYDFKQQGHAFVWSVDTDVIADEQFVDNGYQPALQNINKVHCWQRTNPHTELAHSYGGLRLWPTNRDYSDLTTDKIRLNRVKQLQYVKEQGCTYKPFEIVFLSYHEPYAENAYKRLTARFDVHWVKDIEGIFAAHKEASNRVQSAMFWVVDADADVDENFTFNYIPDVYDQEVVHVWASMNPITGQEYGYGGIKLFNTQQVRDANSWGLDFTTGLSSRFKAMPELSCVTKFNTDAYSTWRSAFRESIKLSLNGDDESTQRLEGWLNPVPEADFKEEAKRGAEEGVAFAKKFINKPLMLAKINDYDWLKDKYTEG